MVAVKDAFEGSSSDEESARCVMKLLSGREAWRVRAMVVADGKEKACSRRDVDPNRRECRTTGRFLAPRRSYQSRQVTLEKDSFAPECQVLSSLYCK